jgi:hypothetical protein
LSSFSNVSPILRTSSRSSRTYPKLKILAYGIVFGRNSELESHADGFVSSGPLQQSRGNWLKFSTATRSTVGFIPFHIREKVEENVGRPLWDICDEVEPLLDGRDVGKCRT